MRQAFQTEIHDIDVAGVHHIANMTNPRIPAALSGVVAGVVSLHDFRPHPDFKPRPAYTFTSGGSTFEAVVPADLATIYNFKPLFAAGISGQGQSVVVIEDTNVYSTANWTTFRSVLGLSSYTGGSFTQTHPTGKQRLQQPRHRLRQRKRSHAGTPSWASAGAPSASHRAGLLLGHQHHLRRADRAAET